LSEDPGNLSLAYRLCLRPVRDEMFIVLEQQNTPSPFGGAETDLKDKSQTARPLLRTEKVVLLAFTSIDISLLTE
jgi:hypothetical protein